MLDAARLPLTLLTGFLGSGKTTLLNQWLKQPEMRDTLVIVNEFGNIGLDHLLVAHQVEQEMVVELSNGCLCCQLRTDLKKTLRDIQWRFSRNGERQFKRVVIETSGLADPAPILHTLMTDAYIAAAYQLDGVVTIVDAVLGEATLAQHPEAVKQVQMADRILISKTDMTNELVGLQSRLQQLNPIADISLLNTSAPAPELLFGMASSAAFPHWLSAMTQPTVHGIATHVTSLVLDKPLPQEDFDDWLALLRDFSAPELLRFKGIFYIEGASSPVAIHRVQHVLHASERLAEWPAEERLGRLVFITQSAQEDILQELLQPLARFASAHREY